MFIPEFASTIYFELRKGTNQLYLNIYFKNKNDMYPVVVPGCQFDCYIDDFERILADYIIDGNVFESDCKNGRYLFK